MKKFNWLAIGVLFLALLALGVRSQNAKPRPLVAVTKQGGGQTTAPLVEGHLTSWSRGPEGVEKWDAHIHVVDPSGVPVPGALVAVKGGESATAEGKTGADGSVTISLTCGQNASLVATAECYKESEIAVVDNEVRVDIVLWPALRGLIRDPSGGPPPANTLVLAWGDGAKPSPMDIWESLGGDDPEKGIYQAYCDESGAYEIGVSSLDAEYVICAGGDGYVSHSPGRVIASPGEKIQTLQVHPAYGALVKFRTPGGALPPASPQLDAMSAPGFRYSGKSARIYHDDLALVLAGLDPAFTATCQGQDIPWFMTGPWPASQEVEVSVDVDIIGLKPIARSVAVPFLGDGLSEEIIEVNPTSEHDGSIVLRFSRTASAWLDSTNLIYGGVRVMLWEELSGRDIVYAAKSCDPSGAFRIEGVPRGRYSLRVKFWDNSYLDLNPDAGLQPLIKVVVDGGVVEIDCSDLEFGAIDFSLYDEAGGEILDGVRLDVGRLDQSGTHRSSGVYAFSSPPFRVPFRLGGMYGAIIERPRMQNVAVDGNYTFLAELGVVTSVDVRYIGADIIPSGQ